MRKHILTANLENHIIKVLHICFQSSRTSLGLDNARLPNLIFSANFDKQKTNNRADVFLMAPFIVW